MRFSNPFQELTKPLLCSDSCPPVDFIRSYNVLGLCLRTGLVLLHPIMPYLTEELYQRFPRAVDGVVKKESVMLESYPDAEEVRNS